MNYSFPEGTYDNLRSRCALTLRGRRKLIIVLQWFLKVSLIRSLRDNNLRLPPAGFHKDFILNLSKSQPAKWAGKYKTKYPRQQENYKKYLTKVFKLCII